MFFPGKLIDGVDQCIHNYAHWVVAMTKKCLIDHGWVPELAVDIFCFKDTVGDADNQVSGSEVERMLMKLGELLKAKGHVSQLERLDRALPSKKNGRKMSCVDKRQAGAVGTEHTGKKCRVSLATANC